MTGIWSLFVAAGAFALRNREPTSVDGWPFRGWRLGRLSRQELQLGTRAIGAVAFVVGIACLVMAAMA